MTIGGNDLTPTFDPETLSYTFLASASTNVIEATSNDPTAVIVIKHNDVELGTDNKATWVSGEDNIITITVTDTDQLDETETTTYTVTVTKEIVNSSLATLTIGGNDLTPTFDPETLSYTFLASASTNVIEATSNDPTAVIVIKHNDVELGTDNKATWVSRG